MREMRREGRIFKYHLRVKLLGFGKRKGNMELGKL
jgi:hypothetical protein